MHAHLALSISLLHGPAPEAPDPTAELELRWQAPAECPDAAEVRERIAKLLASVDAQGSPRALRVRGTVTTAEDGAGMRLTLRIAEGEAEEQRELVGADCREVTEAAALIVAMTLQPSVVGSAVPSETETIPEPTPEPAEASPDDEHTPVREEPAPAEVPAAAPRPTVAPRDRSPTVTSRRALPLRVGAEVEGGLGLGPLPRVAGVVAAAVGLRGPWFRVDATGAYWAPRRSEARDPGVRAQLWSLGARGCGVPEVGRVQVPLCAGVVAGLMHARGVGDVVSQRASSPWAAAIASATLVVRVLPWLGVRLGAEGHVAFARPSFHTDPSGTRVHRADAGGVAVRAGLEFDFEVP